MSHGTYQNNKKKDKKRWKEEGLIDHLLPSKKMKSINCYSKVCSSITFESFSGEKRKWIYVSIIWNYETYRKGIVNHIGKETTQHIEIQLRFEFWKEPAWIWEWNCYLVMTWTSINTKNTLWQQWLKLRNYLKNIH